MKANELCIHLSEQFKNCSDFFIRETFCGKTQVYFAGLSGLCDKNYVSDNILKPFVTRGISDPDFILSTEKDFLAVMSAVRVTPVPNENKAVEEILAGNAVLFSQIGEIAVIVSVPAKNEQGRAINEPDSEVVVRGPRQGFVENAETNMALIRKIISSNELKCENITVGNITKTSVRIVYLDGICEKNALEILRKRISEIMLDSVLDSGYIEQYLQKKGYSFFPEVGNSEKPDKVAAKLLEGRIAIICDGSPCVLTVPYLFDESLQSTEDYLKTAYYATLMRTLRFLGLMFSLFMPAIYLCAVDYHGGLLPQKLFESVMSKRQDIPFGVFTEILVILLIFELIREVGIRMPKAVGDAVSIVGGLILGDAAIKAGIASEPVIMVTALTAISNFINPPFMNNSVIIRLVNLVAAKMFGVFGIAVCLFMLIAVLCSKDSFGVPYMYPFAPASRRGLTDALVLLPKRAITRSTSELSQTKE